MSKIVVFFLNTCIASSIWIYIDIYQTDVPTSFIFLLTTRLYRAEPIYPKHDRVSEIYGIS